MMVLEMETVDQRGGTVRRVGIVIRNQRNANGYKIKSGVIECHGQNMEENE